MCYLDDSHFIDYLLFLFYLARLSVTNITYGR